MVENLNQNLFACYVFCVNFLIDDTVALCFGTKENENKNHIFGNIIVSQKSFSTAVFNQLLILNYDKSIPNKLSNSSTNKTGKKLFSVNSKR